MTTAKTNRQHVFAARPQGAVGADTFGLRTTPVPAVEPGTILCRNLWISVDPYLRLKMHDRESYTPPLQIGEPIPGRSVAQVVESGDPAFGPGDLVAIQGGWQDYALVRAQHAEAVDPALAAPESWLGALGMTGFTAYAGLLGIGQPKAGETVVVSAAGGAVGSLVGQIARAQGCRAVGIAGGAPKCASVVQDFGFDACVDYRADDYAAQLARACPDGVDVYFENVGGPVAAAVTPLFNMFGRIAVCGLIAQYDGQQGGDPGALDEFMRWVLVRRLSVRGFIVYDLYKDHPEFTETMAGWLRTGQVVERFNRHDGFDQIVPAFTGMLGGRNIGKSIVRIADPA
ncbi:MAG: putative NADP-dependent oxidoreductase [Rhodobacteraceae bacterium HLUCCA12]|nr:MAG: putative NADP-dependent oxidoreductase [Rhodobacteraceae bacterium HLUCCA12]